MKTISVKASLNYDVIIGTDLLPQLGSFTSSIRKNCKAAIISDSNVWPLYGRTAVESLIAADIEPIHYVFPAGEANKNTATYLNIVNFLADNKITRSDVVVALGGGVVGDVTGFAAATFLRGIAYIQVPTTLLAMVDSSVGGKTAIDLPAGKNLVGAFKQPSLVLCDVTTLNTLPSALFLDGCAEVIKYSILYDKDLFSYLSECGPEFDRETVIAKCVAFKRDVVQEDEFDTGARQKLNLGHTIAHGIETGSNFRISHGQAVAAGLAIVTKAGVIKGFCAVDTYESVCCILNRFSLPDKTTFTASELYTAALSDKKRAGSSVNLIIPRDIGKCDIVPTPVSELESFIEAGL